MARRSWSRLPLAAQAGPTCTPPNVHSMKKSGLRDIEERTKIPRIPASCRRDLNGITSSSVTYKYRGLFPQSSFLGPSFDDARLVTESQHAPLLVSSTFLPVANNNESTPLLRSHNSDGVESGQSAFARIKSVLAARDQPSYAQSFRSFLFGTWWNILLVFIPLSFVSHHLNWDAGLRFGFSFMAIMPLAQVCIWYSIAVLNAHSSIQSSWVKPPNR